MKLRREAADGKRVINLHIISGMKGDVCAGDSHKTNQPTHMNKYLPTSVAAAVRSLLLVGAMAFASSTALADPFSSLWYSGDPTLYNDWGNQGSGGLTYYQGFTVTDAAGWTITDVYSIGPYWSLPASAEWQIRTGMSPGNGGTIVAGGIGAATNTAYMGSNVVNVSIGSLFLAQGNYWLEVAGGGITMTTGANAVGVTGSTLRDWPMFSQSYIDMSYYGPASSGVVGSVGRVPEAASTLALLGLGCLVLVGVRRRVGT